MRKVVSRFVRLGSFRLFGLLLTFGLALSLSTCSAKPDSKQRVAQKAPEIPPVPSPPVRVTVLKTTSGGDWLYHYFVRNGSAFPINAVEIGFNGLTDAPELTLRPKGWDVDAGIPAGNSSAPPGWQVQYTAGAEGDSTGTLRWESTDVANEIKGGLSQAGFDVRVSEEDALYETAHWTVHLSLGSAGYYTGSLQPETVTGAQTDPMESLGRLKISPQPASGVIKIQFDLPSRARVNVEVFDVQGRLVRDLPAMELAAGSQVVTWDGKDAKGKSVSTGMYFVRVMYGSVERFGRLVISR